MSYNANKKVRTKDLKSLAQKSKSNDDTLLAAIGTLSSLNTSAKGNIVAAINEILSQRGALSSLTTSDKTSIVKAINTLVSICSTINTNIGTLSSLSTSAKSNLVAAINALQTLVDTAQSSANTANSNIGTLSSLTTSANGNLVAAVNEIVTARGALSSLTTSDKTSIVKAINTVKTLADTGIANTTSLQTLVSPLLADNVQAHNSFARGTTWGNLGNSLTAEQSSAIAAGTFKDIYPGDSWHFSNVAYSYEDENGVTQSATFSGYFMVAECDYYFSMGENSRFNQHHVLVIPTDVLFSGAQMNASNTREGGYVASLMHTVHRKRAEAIFKACFGEQHVLTFEDKYSSGEPNANGNVTSDVWASCQAQLLNERMIFGNTIESADHYANSSSRQLAILRYRPFSFVGSNSYWLRDIGIRGGFVIIDSNGNINTAGPNKSYGVRAYALIQ